MFRIRIIPATIATAAVLLAVKIVDVTRGTQALSNETLIPQVEAEDTAPKIDKSAKPADKKADDKKTDDKKADAKPDAKTAGDKKEGDKKDEAKKDDGKKGEAKKEGDKKEGEKKADNSKDNKAVSPTPPDETVDHRFTTVEVELLENLARRRDELDHWEQNLQIKEEALGATEKRIDEKIAQIDSMKKEIAELLGQYNEKEDAKIRSLVKIYENMKPPDAARIFDEIEMPILLQVIDKMSEKKAAPILAAMDPKKAKQLTVQLAEQRRMAVARLNIPPAPTTAPMPAAAAPAAPATPAAAPAATPAAATPPPSAPPAR